LEAEINQLAAENGSLAEQVRVLQAALKEQQDSAERREQSLQAAASEMMEDNERAKTLVADLTEHVARLKALYEQTQAEGEAFQKAKADTIAKVLYMRWPRGGTSSREHAADAPLAWSNIH
jgi:cell division septum initiation protein DivIVA